MDQETTKLNFDDSSMIINWDPKKSKGLIQLPKTATLQEVIELINDCNFNINGDKELIKKWLKYMPNDQL